MAKDSTTSLRSRPIIETPRLSVFEEQLGLPDGSSTTRLRVRHPGAVVILACNENNEVVFIKQYRRSIKQELLELPAGTLEAGEEPLSCAKRELAEETGYHANHWSALGLLYPAPGFCDELQHLFFASDLTPGTAAPEQTEDISLELISLEESRNRVKSLEIVDAKTLSALYRAELLGLFAK